MRRTLLYSVVGDCVNCGPCCAVGEYDKVVSRVAQSSNGPRVGCLFYPSGARTDAPRYDLAACRKSGAATDMTDIRNA